tara:strand:+ start:411 stop:881 length:471 start_codon:yes stop_codon:yes gene_type:complete
MSYKNKGFILCIILIIIIQILLYINNTQKSSFRYFIWNIQEVKIGKLISFSFMAGILISSIMNNTIMNNHINKFTIKDDNEDDNFKDNENNNFINIEENSNSMEIPPQRDLRETQPTISVNYRVIKNNGDNDLKEEMNFSNDQKYQDDWSNNETDW